MQTLGKRIWDRKWMLLGLLLFWALALLVNRQLLSGAGLIALWSLMLVCSILCVLWLSDRWEKNFLLLAGLIGIFFLVIAPFACIIDEDYHFMRAYALSSGRLFPALQGGVWGLSVPAGFAEYAKPGEWNLLNIWQAGEIWFSPVTGTEFVARVRSASYLPLDYLFAAVGVGVGRLLNLPLLGVVLLGRLTNYAAYVAAAYLAIKKARYYKSLFFLVAAIPCCLYAGAVYSIDAPLIACSLLYVSIALNYCLDASRTRISRADFSWLLVSAAFILSAKYLGYCLLLPLILFAAKRGLKHYKAAVWSLIGLTALVAGWQVWALLAFSGSVDSGAAAEGVSVAGQLKWAWSNKGEFLSLVAHDFVLNLPQRLYAYSYSEEPVFSFLSLPLRFLPFIAAARAKDKAPLSLCQRRAFNAYWLLAAAAMMLLCNVAVYFSWNPVGASAIDGVHFRYTMPYMIFILLAFSTLSPVNGMKNWERRVSFLMALSLLNMTLGTLLYVM